MKIKGVQKSGKVYKITDTENPSVCYIGSTMYSLSNRLSRHKSKCKTMNFKNSKLYSHFAVHGWQRAKIELLEVCNGSKLKLRTKEKYYIMALNANLNMLRPCLTKKERKQEQQKFDKKRNATKHRIQYMQLRYMKKKTANRKIRIQEKLNFMLELKEKMKV